MAKAELTFSLVEGEAEEKFLAKVIQEMQQHRSKNFKGGKNKGGRGKQSHRKRRNDDRSDHKGGKRAKVDGD